MYQMQDKIFKTINSLTDAAVDFDSAMSVDCLENLGVQSGWEYFCVACFFLHTDANYPEYLRRKSTHNLYLDIYDLTHICRIQTITTDTSLLKCYSL